MKVVQGLENWFTKTPVGSIALGYFDGVHIGHRNIILTTVQMAHQKSLPSVVLSFEPHPLSIINPNAAPKLITSFNEKTKLIENLGVDFFLILPFTTTLATTDAFTFARKVLSDTLKTQHVTVGYNYTFGHKGNGSPEKLTAWSQALGFQVTVVSPVTVNGKTVSSSRIRRLISQGQITDAAAALGRWPSISGHVTHGAARGHSLGFPTANIMLDEKTFVLPRFGVYAVRSCYQGRHLYGVANVGIVPTYDNHTSRLEVHFFDFHEDLYGKPLCIELISFLRSERKFASANELKNQIAADKQEALRILTYANIKMNGDCSPLVYNRGAL